MLALAALVLLPDAAQAQEIEVPAAVQIPLFLKVLTFDRQRDQSADADLVVGVTFQSGYRASISTRDEVSKMLRSQGRKKLRIVLIDLDRDALSDVLEQQHVTVVYISPLRAISVTAVASAAAAARVLSMSGVPHYVEQGIAVGVRLQSDRPRLMVNHTASRLAGADFTSELLKLAEIVP